MKKKIKSNQFESVASPEESGYLVEDVTVAPLQKSTVFTVGRNCGR